MIYLFYSNLLHWYVQVVQFMISGKIMCNNIAILLTVYVFILSVADVK